MISPMWMTSWKRTIRVIDHAPKAEECAHGVPAKVYNIGCSHPVRLMDFISEIERAYGKPAQKIFLPMQAGDVYQTNADTTKLETELGYKPSTSTSRRNFSVYGMVQERP